MNAHASIPCTPGCTIRALLRPLATAALALLATASASGAQILGGPEPPPVAWEQRLGERLPLDARFRDHEGREIAFGSLLGERPVVLALVYYECPMLCGLVLEGMLAALREAGLEVGTDFSVVALSIDPSEPWELAAQKRSACVQAYDGAGGADGWTFLVGAQAEIQRVAGAVGFQYALVQETGEYAHGAGLTILTPAGVVSRVLFGVSFEPRDLRLALVEAADGRIGSVIDQILLRCFHYDPANGRYGFAILGTLRLTGIVTVLALGAAVARQLARERRTSLPRAGTT